MYCIIKVGDKYYSGMSPTGRIMTGPDPTDARILDYRDAGSVINILGKGTIRKVEFKDVDSPQGGDIEKFIEYAKQYGYTVSYTMASYAVATCGTNFDACLTWTHNLNKAIMPAVRLVCDKVSAKPEDACEQLLVDGPTDSTGFMARVNSAVVALWGARK